MSEKKEPVRVLHILPGDKNHNYGGTESYLYEYYKHMNQNSVVFDFAFCIDNSLQLREKDPVFENSRFILLNSLRDGNGLSNWLALMKALRKLARGNKYQCAHVQTGSMSLQFCATLALTGLPIPLRIAHSHSACPPVKHNPVVALIRMAVRLVIDAGNDFLFACSRAAGEHLFGKHALDSPKFRVIPNAIDVEAFRYNPSVRESVREAERVSDTGKVIGFVARIAEPKNPLFLVDAFAAFHKLEPDSALWLIGEGDLRGEVEKRVQEYGLDSCVKLWGEHRDVPELLQGMDLFLFPSLREGLGIAAIEAQAAGLPTVVSDAVPNECAITDLFHQLPLRESASFWAGEMSRILRETKRRDTGAEIVKAGYEISAAAAKMERFYLSHTQRARRE